MVLLVITSFCAYRPGCFTKLLHDYVRVARDMDLATTMAPAVGSAELEMKVFGTSYIELAEMITYQN